MLDVLNCLYIIFISYLMLTFTCLLMSIAKKLDIKDYDYDPIKLFKKSLKRGKKDDKED